MAAVVNVNDLLDDHVSLDLECLDRIYLNAYIPNLQVSGQVITFLRDHLKMPIASPAVMEKMGNRFRKAVDAFAEDHDIPIVHFKKGDRHIDVMTPYLEAATEQAKGANRRLLELQRAGPACAIETALWERISQPSLEEGQRTGAVALRGSTRHGPGRCTLCGAQYLRRLHQQEPPRLGVPAARGSLQLLPNDL
jgi:hypothetical protein